MQDIQLTGVGLAICKKATHTEPTLAHRHFLCNGGYLYHRFDDTFIVFIGPPEEVSRTISRSVFEEHFDIEEEHEPMDRTPI